MMTVQKYQDPLLDIMPTRFSTMLDRFFDNTMATSREQWTSFTPKVDTYETEKGYDIEAALPGIKPEDIKVSFEKDRLTISGERKFENERNERHYHVVESSYGSFQRSFLLPNAADPDKIDASFDNGVLHVHVPKDGHKNMQHQIPVKAAATGANANANIGAGHAGSKGK